MILAYIMAIGLYNFIHDETKKNHLGALISMRSCEYILGKMHLFLATGRYMLNGNRAGKEASFLYCQPRSVPSK